MKRPIFRLDVDGCGLTTRAKGGGSSSLILIDFESPESKSSEIPGRERPGTFGDLDG
jgi:hypothetical protein